MKHINMPVTCFGFLIFSLKFLLILGQIEKHSTWDDANKQCMNDGKILSPPHIVDLPSDKYSPKRTMWTSNYLYNLGCMAGTALCTGLYIEQESKETEYNGLCNTSSNTVRRSTQKDKKERVCYSDNLVNINGMRVLFEVYNEIKINVKYWVEAIDIDILDGAIRQCEVYNKFANRSSSSDWQLSKSNCKEDHQFACVLGDKYGTVIKKVMLPVAENSNKSYSKWTKHLEMQDDILGSKITGIITIIAVIIGLAIIAYLLRRWIASMKNELLEAFRQKYDHHMYDVERVEPGGEAIPEPDTPVSPGGSSLYENVQNENALSREANLTVSYMTSREVREITRPVTVPLVGTTARKGTIPRLSIPQRLPSRENAVRHKTGVHQTGSRPKPLRKNRSSSKKSTGTDIMHQDTDTGTLSINPKRYEDESRITEYKKGRPFSKKPKPSPKPDMKTLTLKCKTNSTNKTGDTLIHQSSSEFSFYMNTGPESLLEDDDMVDQDESYENIWMNNR